MKRQLLTLTLLLVSPWVCSESPSFKLGATIWNQEYDARISKGGGYIELDSGFYIDDNADYQLRLQLEHGHSRLPQLRIQHTHSATEGDGILTATVFDKITFEGAVAGDLDLTHTDVVGYYKLMEGDFNLDLGLALRFFDAEVVLTNEQGMRGKLGIDDIIPLLYSNGRFNLPGSSLFFRASANFIAFDGEHVFDVESAIGWQASSAIDLEFGYRYMDIDYKAGSGLIESTNKGFYAGFNWAI